MTNVIVECVQGNIANQPDMDAVVNAANAQLLPGAGVAGAIHSAAGPGLAEECRALAPIQCGQAVISSAHGLPNSHVIHCLGPVYGVDTPSDELLASCYREALLLAEEKGLESVAFPAISTGVFGYPLDEAAQVSARAIANTLAKLEHVRRVRLVLFSAPDYQTYREAFAEAGLLSERE